MANYNRQRLPTLFEVLNRRSQPPVDLWSFYVFMREQYRGVDYLDFWLDVVQHLSLCRHYVRSLRQSILASSERDGSSRASSVLLDTLMQEGGINEADTHRLSAFLRGDDGALGPNYSPNMAASGPDGVAGASAGSGNHNSDTLYRLSALLDAMNAKEKDLADLHAPPSRSDNFASRINETIQERHESGVSGDDKSDTPFVPGPSSGFRGTGDSRPVSEANSFYSARQATGSVSNMVASGNGRASDIRTSTTSSNLRQPGAPRRNPNQHVSISADTIERLFPRRQGDIEDGSSWVTRQDIRQSSHKILVTYFIPGAEREIVLPPHITKTVKSAIEVDGRDDPEVFDEAREYVFQAMEREAFPSFLAARALGNLTPLGSLIRLAVGLLAFFGAFWTGFALIFLDWQPKRTRLWVILPFAVGSYGLFSSLYNLDPLLAIAGYSEASVRRYIRMREPYVRSLLVKRSLYVLIVIGLIAAIFVIIFCLVPGRRL